MAGPWEQYGGDNPAGEETEGPWSGYGGKPTAKPAKAGVIRRIADVGVGLLQGVAQVPDIAVGAADIVTGGRVGKALNEGVPIPGTDANLRFDPKAASEVIGDTLLSDDQKAASRKVSEAQGFLPTLGAIAENPSVIPYGIAQSLPSIGAGGVVGGAVRKAVPTISRIAAGAAGEGAVMAGQAAESIRRETPDQLLTPGQSAAALGTGAAGAAISRLSGGLQARMGLGDVDTAAVPRTAADAVAAGTAKATGAQKSTLRKVGEGMFTEGFLEEMPQSMAEQVIQNLATGKPWQEGVGGAAAMGLVTGAVLGGAMGPFGGKPGEAKPLLLTNEPDPMLAYPDGTVGRRSEVESWLAGLPPEQAATARAKLMGLGPQDADATALGAAPKGMPAAAPIQPPIKPSPEALFATNFETAPGAAPPPVDPVSYEPVLDTNPNIKGVVDTTLHRGPVNVNVEDGPITRAAKQLALPAPGQVAPGTGMAGDGGGNVGTAAQMDLRGREKDAAAGKPDPRPDGDFKDAARAAQPPAPPINPNMGPISRAAAAAQQAQQPQPDASKQAIRSSTAASPTVSRETGDYVPQPGDIVVDDFFEAAADSATNPLNDRPEPTDGQKKAGNYRKGHVKLAGQDISLENRQGSMRRGKDEDGREWEQELKAHYGYIRRTEGADGDHVDVFVKPGTSLNWSGTVYVIDQVNPKTGRFDEHKVIFGANSAPDAARTYLGNYEQGWKGLGAMTPMTLAEFNRWKADREATKRPVGNVLNVTRPAPTAATSAAAAGAEAGPEPGAISRLAGTPAADDAAPAQDATLAPADPDAFELSAEDKAEGTRAKRAAAAQKGRAAAAQKAWDKNPMMAFIARHGLRHVEGQKGSLKTEFSPDKQISVGGVHIAVFRADGLPLDKLLQHAIDEGFLPEGARENDLHGLIDRAINGERIIPAYSPGAADQEAEARARAYEEAQRNLEPPPSATPAPAPAPAAAPAAITAPAPAPAPNPERGEAVELRKRISVLRSLRACVSGK